MLRFDPFRDLGNLSEAITRSARSMLAMDAVRRDHEVIIYVDCPGVPADEIDLSVERNELTIEVERRWDDEGDQQVLTSERPQGIFTRRIVLSDALDADRLEAKVQDGVLVVAIPVAERSMPRRVEVARGTNAVGADDQQVVPSSAHASGEPGSGS